MWQSVSLVLSWNSWTMAKAFGGQPLFFSGRNTAIVFNLTQRIGQFFTPWVLKILSRLSSANLAFPGFLWNFFFLHRQSDLNHQNSTDRMNLLSSKKVESGASTFIYCLTFCLHCITEKKVRKPFRKFSSQHKKKKIENFFWDETKDRKGVRIVV